MKAFRVTGKFKMGHDTAMFSKEYATADKKLAEEKALTDLGSKHRASRRDIKIEKVEELTVDQIKDTQIKQLVEGK